MQRLIVSALVRTVFTIAFLLIAYGLMIEAFHLMNLPSDRALYGGIALILGLILMVPLVVHMLWWRRQ